MRLLWPLSSGTAAIPYCGTGSKAMLLFYFNFSLHELCRSTSVDVRQTGCSCTMKVDTVTGPLPLFFCSFGQIGNICFQAVIEGTDDTT